MRKPRALRPGDRVAVVAPASPMTREDLLAGVEELRSLGFEPVVDERVWDRTTYVAGPADVRAREFLRAWEDPAIAGMISARGGYGSVHLLPLVADTLRRTAAKPFIGYSDTTSLLSWLTLGCGVVSFHGPMVDRLARGAAGYDRPSFLRALTDTSPVGDIVDGRIEVLRSGEASGMLIGGTATLLAASLGTPYAFTPPLGCVLFLEDVGERPYRIDRLITQLRLSGILARASALVFGEMRDCAEPNGRFPIRDVVASLVSDFSGPVLYGVPSGHTSGPMLTLPFGLRVHVAAGTSALLTFTEAAVE